MISYNIICNPIPYNIVYKIVQYVQYCNYSYKITILQNSNRYCTVLYNNDYNTDYNTASKYCIVLYNSTYNTSTNIVILYYCTIVRIVTIHDNTLQYCEVLFSVFTCIVISIVPPTSAQPYAVSGSASGAAPLYHCQHTLSRVDPSFLQSGSGYPSPCIWGTPLPPARAARRRHARRPGQRQHARRRRARSRSRQSCCSCCSTAALASRPSRWGL